MKLATPRKQLVAECCHAAMTYHAMGFEPEARRWIRKARVWRDHYVREIESNNAWIRANPEAARQLGLVEKRPNPEGLSDAR